MISAGIEGRLPYMTYPEPWGGPPKQPPEFLRPAPKPLPHTRYNGMPISTSLNGTRINSTQRSPSATPVNLSQLKPEEVVDDMQYSSFPRLFVPPPPFTYHTTGPYATLYQPSFTPLLRTGYAPPTQSSISPLETKYSPTTLSSGVTSINSAPSTFTSNAVLQHHQLQHQQSAHKLQLQQPPLQLQQIPQTTVNAERKPSPSFKVPSGKEGSLKHRILTRPGDPVISRAPLELERPQEAPKHPESRKRLTATVTSPKSPAKPVNNNNIVPVATFTKGSLIQLANGELRRVEELRTEDFVNSAEQSAEHRLADSTVVKLQENLSSGTTTITLTYNQRRTQVEFETSIEHPFFVYGQGWASCAPERTLRVYGLKVHQLLVGDILVSLTPRENTNMPVSTKGTTIITTATTTAVTSRQISVTNTQHMPATYNMIGNNSFSSRKKNQLSPDYVNNSNKKRRWSAPDQICDEDEQISRRVKI